MRALSIRQPWIELILRGDKDVENRSWSTNHRGPLLLHASQKVEVAEARKRGLSNLPTGCLIGVVDVVECTREIRSSWHITGQFGWYLVKPHRLTAPVPYQGRVGFFHVDLDALGVTLSSADKP